MRAHRATARSAWAVCIALALAVSGCVSLGKRPAVKRRYVLNVERPDAAAGPKKLQPRILKVNPLHISPRFEGKGFVYRTGDKTYEVDFYNEFFISPSLTIAEELRAWLRESGLFRSVVSSRNTLRPTHILDVDVTRLYGDLRAKSPHGQSLP